MASIVVIGAGTVGLSHALRLKEEFGEAVDVTVIAEFFLQDTTSWGSGGFWEPYQIAGTPDDNINSWGKYAFDRFQQDFYSKYAAEAGISQITVNVLLEEREALVIPAWNVIVHNFRVLTADDIQRMGMPSKYDKGYTFGSYVADQKYYMQFLTKRLKEMGVTFEQRKVESIPALTSEYDCVINCTGLGAQTVIEGEEMYPIRGQVLRVRAPWMKGVWFFGTSYIIPNTDTVVLGGTAQKGDWNTTVDIKDTEKILKNIGDVFPALAKAPIENVWVGLRPGRAPLRLDSEVVEDNKLIVHCYGHGGSGITLAMGCAQESIMNHVAPWLQSREEQQYNNKLGIRARL